MKLLKLFQNFKKKNLAFKNRYSFRDSCKKFSNYSKLDEEGKTKYASLSNSILSAILGTDFI